MRESWKPVTIALVSTLAFGILLTIANPDLGVWTLPIMVTAGGFAGLAAFSADQKREGQQFLATHGVSPTRIWITRTVPWMLAICLGCLALYLIIILVLTMSGQIQTTPQSLVMGFFTGFNEGPMLFEFFTRGIMFTFGVLAGFFVAGSMLCFSAGQFVSLAIRSRILAAVVTLIVCLPLVYWLILMVVGGVPIWWSVLPIAMSFLFAGWLSLRGILAAKSVVARVTIPAAIIVLTTALVVVGVVRHRATEIPKIAVVFDRTDNSNPAIIDEIREKFRAPLAAIERPEMLPGSISDYYLAILKTNKRFDSQGNLIPLDDPEAEDWENWNLAEIKQNLFYNYLDGYDRDSWNEARRSNQLPDIDQITKLSAEFLSENQENLEQIREAIDFAWKHQDQLEQRKPWYPFTGGEQPIPRISSFWELLVMEFYRSMDQGDPETAWANLKAMSQFLKLEAIQTPKPEHWYTYLFDFYESWTLCENQRPELLNEAIRFVMKKFLPIDRQRTLEFQYVVMRDRIDSSGRSLIESPFNYRIADSASRFLKSLPWERERARRLIDLRCAMKLDQVKRMVPPLELRSPIDYAMARLWGNPAWIDSHLKTTEKIENLPHPEWLNELKKSDWRFWAQTTIFPSPSYDFGYFEDLTRLDYETRRPEIDLDILYRERKELLLFQMWVVKYKLENNEFPENLDRLGFLTTLKTEVIDNAEFSTSRYFYYPDGLPNGALVAGKDYSNDIPANTPFIANRQAVPFTHQEWLIGPIMTSEFHLLPAHTGLHNSSYEPGPMFILLATEPMEKPD